MKQGTIVDDDLPKFIQGEVAKISRDIMPDRKNDPRKYQMHNDPCMKHVYDAMEKNKDSLEKAILTGEPVIFDHVP